MRWPNDGPPCPDSGPALLARIDSHVCPWQRVRVQMLWLFSGWMRPRRSKGY